MKKTVLILLSLIALYLIIKINVIDQSNKEEKFWNWFVENEHIYYNKSDKTEFKVSNFGNLSNELIKIHEDLGFEFSSINDSGIREFTISAEGEKKLFPLVENLIKKAPRLKNWKFIAFRQRNPGDDLSIEYDGFEIGYKDIFYRYFEQDNELGIELNILNYDGNPKTQNAIYILLDGLIGEYDVTMKIDWIDWVELNEENIKNLYPIINLRQLVDKVKDKNAI